MGSIKRPALNLLRLARSVSIKEQLWIEEALLRHDKRNWCLMKEGEPTGARPTVVLGIGGQPQKLVNQELARRDAIPLLRRFSGGGTVIVDQDSLFITFIMNTEQVTPGEPYPRPIMQWTATVYNPVFQRLRLAPPEQAFELRENDYVFGLLKFGGNAQSIVRDRWLHHTSFLWDFQDRNMAYLQVPERKPEYRGSRGHSSFLTRLKDQLTRGTDRESLFRELEAELSRRFETRHAKLEEAHEVIEGLGGMQAWASQARTKVVPHPEVGESG